ncbi:MAG TPA: hypothetical protein VFS20_02045, partial [Longimicrobium sp.]|nr:hypothetical protein [Longimicrobium sp.]
TGPGGTAVPVALVRVGPFPQEQRDTAAADTGRAARRDTAAARARRDSAAAQPTEPVPSQSLSIRLAQPLAANTDYTVAVRGIRNLLGLVGNGQVQFRTPRAQAQPARADTAAARSPAAQGQPAAPPQGQPAPAPPAPPAPRPQTSPQPVAQPPRPRR